MVTTGLYAGEADYGNIPIQEKEGVRIAYLAYTETTNGLPTPSDAAANVIYTSQEDVIRQQIELATKFARQQADIVVVGVHWGVEGSHTPSGRWASVGACAGTENCGLGRGCHYWHAPACHPARGAAYRSRNGQNGSHCLFPWEILFPHRLPQTTWSGVVLTFDIANNTAGRLRQRVGG